VIFCTLFNRLYLPQGIALYRSLERTAGDGFILYALCMDEFSADALLKFNFPHLRIVHLRDIEDDALRAVRPHRSVGEYCWTCTTPLLLHVQDRHPLGTVVTYVDADILFFSDPSAILAELGNRSIFIHEHDFAPHHAHLLPAAGRFNVGVVAFRNDDEGRRCLVRWRAQCLDECVMDPSAGKCGDQNYLDEWPKLYPGLVISKNPGIGLAPWNVEKHRVHRKNNAITVDERPVVFYHYHSLRILKPRLGVKAIVMAVGEYFFDDAVLCAFYRPYARALWRAVSDLRRAGYSIVEDLQTIEDYYSRITYRQVLISIFGAFVPLRIIILAFRIRKDWSRFLGRWSRRIATLNDFS
jgi:hypothetical protein